MDIIENYKKINAEMCQKIIVLKSENAKLKDENKRMIADSLELIRLKKQITDSQKIQFEHVSALTIELQSFVGKINEIAISNNKRNQVGEQSASNLSADNSEASRRMSEVHESQVERRVSASMNDQEEIGLHTIAEESEEDYETDTTRNTTSQCQSTIASLNSIQNSLLDPNRPTSIQPDAISIANYHSIASNSSDSNKEIQSSQSPEEQIEYYGALKNADFVTNRHTEQDMTNHSNKDEAMSGMVSSTETSTSSTATNTSSTATNTSSTETSTEQSILTLLSESDVCETEAEATYVSNTQSKRVRNTTKSSSILANDSSTIGTNTKDVEIDQSDSITNSHSVASNLIDSNKENQSSKDQIEYFGALSPLNKVDFVTNRRKKRDETNHSNENGGVSGPVASTPYKQIVSETNTEQTILTILNESDVCATEAEETHVSNTRSKRVRNTTISFSTLTNDSLTIGTNTEEVDIVPSKRAKNTRKVFSDLSNGATATETMPIESSNTRPKRKATQNACFVEPKLNTKLRRPLSMKPKVIANPKRT